MAERTEQWVPCREFPEHYAVSDLGRVMRTATGGCAKPGKILAEKPHRGGYRVVVLSVEGLPYYRTVHRLVAEAFLGERGDFEVNHLSGVKSDNRRENLEYTTRTENQRHAVRMGLISYDSRRKHPLTKRCACCGEVFTPHVDRRGRAKTCSVSCARSIQRTRPTSRKRSDGGS